MYRPDRQVGPIESVPLWQSSLARSFGLLRLEIQASKRAAISSGSGNGDDHHAHGKVRHRDDHARDHDRDRKILGECHEFARAGLRHGCPIPPE